MIHYFDSLTSTNDFCLQNMADLDHGVLVLARLQTAGRGRRGRQWSSDRIGDFYGSLILRPPADFDWRTLPMLTATAVCDRVRQAGVTSAWIKWPNDIWAADRKLAGMLIEVDTAQVPGVVVGIGVNLAATAEDLENIDQPATSVFLETGVVPELEAFAGDLRNSLLNGYERILHGEGEQILEAWRQDSRLPGRRATMHLPDGSRMQGRIRELSADGGLVLETDDGQQHAFLAGDLSLDLG